VRPCPKVPECFYVSFTFDAQDENAGRTPFPTVHEDTRVEFRMHPAVAHPIAKQLAGQAKMICSIIFPVEIRALPGQVGTADHIHERC